MISPADQRILALKREIKKLKAELEDFKELHDKDTEIMKAGNDRLQELKAALKIADEDLEWIGDYINEALGWQDYYIDRNYVGMKYLQKRIAAFRQKIKEILSDISGKGEK